MIRACSLFIKLPTQKINIYPIHPKQLSKFYAITANIQRDSNLSGNVDIDACQSKFASNKYQFIDKKAKNMLVFSRQNVIYVYNSGYRSVRVR